MIQTLRTWHQKFLGLFVLNPSSGTTLPYMDGIRAVAVLLVLVVHTWWFAGSPRFVIPLPFTGRAVDLAPLAEFSQVGVDLFFVLSGFLLAQPWLRADYEGRTRPDRRRYAMQRVLRIVPAYYVCIFLVLLFFAPKVVDPTALYSGAGALAVAAHLIFLHFTVPVTAGTFNVFGHFWTLTIEALFYCSLPFVIALFVRDRWMKTLPVVVAITVGWLYLCRHGLNWLVHLDQTVFAQPPNIPGPAFLYNPADPGHPSAAGVRFFLARQYPAHFVHFALGIALANIFVRYHLRREESRLFRALTHPWAGKCYFLLGSGIVLFFMRAVSLNSRQYGYSYEKMVTEPGARLAYYGNELPFAVGFTLLMAGVIFGGPWLRACFSLTPLRFIGICGYSIYLWHYPVLVLFASFPNLAPVTEPGARFWQLIGSALAVLTILGAGSYLLIEKPFMARGRRVRAHPDPLPEPQPEFSGAATRSAQAYLD